MAIREEVRSFLQQTSIKGIPRAVKAKRKFLKVLWIISTFAFLSLAFWQVTELVSEYLTYPTTTVMEETNVGIEHTDSVIQTPVLTVCNLNSFAGNTSHLMRDLGLPTLAQFRSLVINMTTCPECDHADRELLGYIRDDLLTPEGYFAHIGKKNASLLGHMMDNFIIECLLFPKQGFRSYMDLCNASYFKLFVSYSYYNCWSLEVPEELDSHLEGISLMVHLDNFYMEQFDHLHVSHPRGQQLGALLLAHGRGTFPGLMNKAIYLQPGVYTDVRLQIAMRSLKPPPYSDCAHGSVIEGTTWAYSTETCVSACLERLVVDTCNCQDLFMLNVLGEYYSQQNISYCNALSGGQQVLLKRSRCAEDIRKSQYNPCLENCPSPCEEIEFPTHISTGLWPPNPHYGVFYRDYIAGRLYERHYAHIADVLANFNGSVGIDVLLARVSVADNFLRVDVSLKDVSYIEYKDIASISFATFLSQLGGILNLFAGITIVIVVELLDLLICLFFPQGKSIDISSKATNIPNGKQI